MEQPAAKVELKKQLETKSKNVKKNCHKKEKKHPCYDVVVVGAGTAGAVVAKRVSDNYCLSVLLLEQGRNENENPIVFNPFGFNPERSTLNLFAAATDPKTTDITFNQNFLGGTQLRCL